MTDSSVQQKMIQAQLIKTEIPELLAKMVLNGQKEAALDLLIAWGTHNKNNEQIWTAAKEFLQTQE